MHATLILGLALIAQAAPLSVKELLTAPDRFNAQPVTVSGTMSDFRANQFRRGNAIYTFDLSEGTQTVHVVSFEKPPCRSGAVTVEGTFEHVKRRVSYSLEEITARKVTCIVDLKVK